MKAAVQWSALALWVVIVVGCSDYGDVERAESSSGNAIVLHPESLAFVDSALVNVRSVAELSATSVVIGDGSSQEVRLVRFEEDGTVSQVIGGRGEGPGEYLSVAWLLTGSPRSDTVSVWDPKLGRLSKFAGAEMLPAGTESFELGAPVGIGGSGQRLTVTKSNERRTPLGFRTDSLAVTWSATPTGEGVDVAVIGGPSSSVFRHRGRGIVAENPVLPPGQALLVSSEWIVVVRPDPLSLEWHRPRTGEVMRWLDERPARPFEVAHRHRALANLGLPAELADYLEWPDFEPSFPKQGPGLLGDSRAHSGTVLAGPGDCVSVLRTTEGLGEETTFIYEIFDREEGLLTTLRVPPLTFLAGFGRATGRAYLVERGRFSNQLVWRSAPIVLPDGRCVVA